MKLGAITKFFITAMLVSIQLSSLSDPARLSNLSTRAKVGTGNEVLIGGLVIKGNTTKNVIIRALGPSLANSDVEGVLQDPTVKLFDTTGPIDENDNWQEHANAQLIPTNLQPKNDNESAIFASLNPGAYTAIIRGKDASTGIALIEVYELNENGETQLINISTRGPVGTGDEAMIGGVVITGTEPKTIAIRALGLTLASSGVPGVLQDPTVKLFSTSGAIDENDNGDEHPFAQFVPEQLRTDFDNESVIIRTLEPGAYTAIVRGNGGTSGIALVEVFDIDVSENLQLIERGETSVSILETLQNDGIEITIEKQPSNGYLEIEDGSYKYTPRGNFNGTDSVSYSVSADGQSLRRSIEFQVQDINDAPVAVNQTLLGAEDEDLEFSLRATDAEGDNISFNIVDAPDHGELKGTGVSQIYKPDADFFGTDSLAFTASDTELTSKEGTIDIKITSLIDDGASEDAGSPKFSDKIEISSRILSPSFAIARDFDGDRDLDIFFYDFFGFLIYRNKNGKGNFVQFQNLPRPAGSNPGGIAAGDLNGDDLTDVIVMTRRGAIVWYENQQTKFEFGEQMFLGNSSTNGVPLLTFDADRDGDLDILVALSRTIFWFENIDGLGHFSERQTLLALDSSAISLQVADIDGDNDDDFVLKHFNRIVWSRYDKTTHSYSTPFTIALVSNPLAVDVGDIDGDGDMDIVSASITSEQFFWFENLDGKGAFGLEREISASPQFFHFRSGGNIRNIRLVDIDSDGDLDFLANPAVDLKMAYFENLDGNGSFGEPHIITDENIGPEFVDVADIDGDGKVDVFSGDFTTISDGLEGGNNNQVLWFKNLGH